MCDSTSGTMTATCSTDLASTAAIIRTCADELEGSVYNVTGSAVIAGQPWRCTPQCHFSSTPYPASSGQWPLGHPATHLRQATFPSRPVALRESRTSATWAKRSIRSSRTLGPELEHQLLRHLLTVLLLPAGVSHRRDHQREQQDHFEVRCRSSP